ncbi:MAG: hypothetical protein ACTHMS_10440 [Jatrophihabitans sp.]|uniref:hypothetical protein n=1 Tax=Jatrophihabitans sp. TaxID=1932789 RepID=UPI003F81C7BD
MIPDGSESSQAEPKPARSGGLDPVAALAVATGVAGIFVLQLLLVVVTMLLSSIAAQRARGGRYDLGYAYLAFGVGAVDGVLLLIGLLAGGEAPTPLNQ